jgi:hypothetical protein
MDAAALYVKNTPLAEYCWPFVDIRTLYTLRPDDGGAMHSAWLSVM